MSAAGDQRDDAHARICAEAIDLCWKATPHSVDETDAIRTYVVPAGVMHRLLGALQAAGHPAAFRGAPDPEEVR